MTTQRIRPAACLAAVLLAAAWLTFSARMIGATLFPPRGLLVTASEGARVQIEHGVVRVLAGPAGVVHFSGVLIPAVAVPFVLLVVFAVVGCLSLFRTSTGQPGAL